MQGEGSQLIVQLVLVLVSLILSTAVHEFAHVAVARWLGDDTGTRMGRYTLNPLVHIDPLWTVVLPAIMILTTGGFFGAGKPAPYNPLRLDREFNGKRITIRTAELLVALAGPASNIVMCVVTSLLLFALSFTGVLQSFPLAWTILSTFITLNLVLAFFNMLPIPPLDGSKILFSLLPDQLARRYEAVATRLSWVLLLVFIGVGGYVLSPLIRFSREILIGWIA
jgi:Zn-dependent protease